MKATVELNFPEDKHKYAQFLIGDKKLVMTEQSRWECRNSGLLKIMTRVFENLQGSNFFKEEYTIRINTDDIVTKDRIPEVQNYIEFDTSTESMDESKIFPDSFFGNWWPIGLVDFDDFVKEICDSNKNPIKDHRIFWIGAPQNVQQRIKYLELCKNHPDKLCGDEIGWTNNGMTPTKFVPIKDHCNFKYLIDLTGQGISGRLKYLPFCSRPLFITSRKFWAWSDILILKQNLHIPVKDDLSDLFEKYYWAEKNQEVVLDNSINLLNFCKTNFTFTKVCEVATKMIVNAVKEHSNNRM